MTGFERYRKKHLLTQSELADLLGVSPQAVGRWETGTGTPTVSMLQKISKLYDVSMEDLVRNDYPESGFEELLQRMAEKGA